MTYSSITIANYFISRYSSLGKLTPMKVIKLTYLAYSWYIALNDGNERLIRESPQAWDYGPVFPRLYDSLKKYGRTVIDTILPYDTDETISEDDSLFLDKIWKMYGKFDGVKLSAMTHSKDTPWDKSYSRFSNSVISDSDIINHYSPMLKPKSTEV